MGLSAQRFQFRRTKSEPVLKTEWEPAKENISAPPPPVAAAATNGGRVIRPSNSVRHMFGTLSSAVQKLWKGLCDETSKIPKFVYSDDPASASNSSNVRCVEKNRVTVNFRGEDGSDQCHALHANRVEIKTKNASGEDQDNRYVAGQSPNPTSLTQAANPMQPGEFLACEKLLVQGIESGLGIFQFVSPKAHFTPKESQERPIIDQLMEQLEGDKEKKGILIGGRYRVVIKDERNPLGFSSGAYQRGNWGPEYKCVNLQVTLEEEKDKSFAMPITQVGLKYTDSLLQVADIKKANEILEAHKAITSNRKSFDGQSEPAIISYAGVGRNATLIVYREIQERIKNKAIKSVEALDAALGEIIIQGRSARGPYFVHSAAQLNELREAFLPQLGQEAEPAPRPVPRPAPQPVPQPVPRPVPQPMVLPAWLRKVHLDHVDLEAGFNSPPDDRVYNQPNLRRGWARGDGNCLFHSVAFASALNGPGKDLIAQSTKGRATDPRTVRRFAAQNLIDKFDKFNKKPEQEREAEQSVCMILSALELDPSCRIKTDEVDQKIFEALFGSSNNFEIFSHLSHKQKVHVISTVMMKQWDSYTGDNMPLIIADAFPGLCILVYPSNSEIARGEEFHKCYSGRGAPEQTISIYLTPNHYSPIIPSR